MIVIVFAEKGIKLTRSDSLESRATTNVSLYSVRLSSFIATVMQTVSPMFESGENTRDCSESMIATSPSLPKTNVVQYNTLQNSQP